MRGIQSAAAFRFYRWRLGILDHPPSRMMTGEIQLFKQQNAQLQHRHCERSEAIHAAAKKESKSGLLRRGACHRAPIRATRWLLAEPQLRDLAAGFARVLPLRSAF
jgi:hypothetical protein